MSQIPLPTFDILHLKKNLDREKANEICKYLLVILQCWHARAFPSKKNRKHLDVQLHVNRNKYVCYIRM